MQTQHLRLQSLHSFLCYRVFPPLLKCKVTSGLENSTVNHVAWIISAYPLNQNHRQESEVFLWPWHESGSSSHSTTDLWQSSGSTREAQPEQCSMSSSFRQRL